MVDLRRRSSAKLQRLQHPLLRPEPGRPPDDAGHHRRRDAERPLHLGGVVALFGDVFTLVVIMAWMLVADLRLALVAFAVIPFVLLAARGCSGGTVRQRLPRHPGPLARINALPAGARCPGCGWSSCSGARRSRRAVRRCEPGAPRGEPRVDHRLRAVLPGDRSAHVAWPSRASCSVRRRPRRSAHTLTVGVLAAFLQLARRFFRPLQDLSEKYNIAAVGDGVVGAGLPLLDDAGDGARRGAAGALPAPVRGDGRRSRTSGSAIARRRTRRTRRAGGRAGRAPVGAARRLVHRPAGAHGGARGPHRGGEDHDHQPAAAVLRRGARAHHRGRRGRARPGPGGAAGR